MANNDFYANLSYDKIKINFNKNPIEISLFLSFLTIPVIKSNDNAGIYNGWTLYENKEHNLSIGGGYVAERRKEYLDSIQYGIKQQNQYNNYCNPFYLFPIMNDTGKAFFVQYYMSDIEQLIEKSKNSVENLELKLVAAKVINSYYEDELKTLKTYLNK
jgi:hypothetical protein